MSPKRFKKAQKDLLTQKELKMKFLKLSEVKKTTGLSRSSIYQFIKNGCFPTQVKLGERAVAWVSSEIDEWINERIANRGEV